MSNGTMEKIAPILLIFEDFVGSEHSAEYFGMTGEIFDPLKTGF